MGTIRQFKPKTGKLPLESVQVERAALSLILAQPGEFWGLKDRLVIGLFTVSMHRRIVDAMHALADAGQPVTLAMLSSKVASDPEGRDDYSVEGYLADLVAEDPDQDSIPVLLSELEAMWCRRQMAQFGEALIRQAREDNGLDPISRIEAAKQEAGRISDRFGDSVRHIGEVGKSVMARVSAAYKAETVIGLPVGLKSVQDLTGPLMPGRLYILCGAPGSGKSALASEIAEYVAQTAPVLMVEAEMPDEEVVERIMSGRADVEAEKIERAALDETEMDRIVDAQTETARLHLWIDSTSNPTVAQIRAKATRLQRQGGLALLIIDHLLYIAPPDGIRARGEHEVIRANLQALKALAKDLRIPVILLTQPKVDYSAGPVRRPKVSDLYGGSANEQEADVILLLWRKEYMLRRNEPEESSKDYPAWRNDLADCEGKAELILGKRRGAKGFGLRTCYFDARRMRFMDRAAMTPRNDAGRGLF